jgi:hypothetical protein
LLVAAISLDEAALKAGIADGTHRRAKTALRARLLWKPETILDEETGKTEKKWRVRLRTEREIAEREEELREK